MIRRILPLLALLSLPAFAQTTHTFQFGALDSNGNAAITEWDGASNPNGNGAIQVRYDEGQYWGLECEAENFGYPNNCFLPDNTITPNLSAPVFTLAGCGLEVKGCTDYETGTANVGGVTVSVTVNFQVHYHPGYRGGKGYYTNDPYSGSGTTTY